MTKQTIFGMDERFTEDGLRIAGEFEDAIAELVDKYKDQYSLRELEYCAISAANIICLSRII